MHFFVFLLAIRVANAAFSINSKASILEAAAKVADNLMAYYSPNEMGVIPPVESETSSGFQWFEMGMFWGAMMEYSYTSKDDRYLNVIGQLHFVIFDSNFWRYVVVYGKCWVI